MTKIKSAFIKGLRGVRFDLFLDLDEKSILLYGESGSGKSSITDAIEWFYYDSIEHLISEEIDRKGGITALRNILLSDDEPASIKIEFSDKKLNTRKKIELKRDSLIIEQSNNSPEFQKYLEESIRENLILRHDDLGRFIVSSKTEKLKELSSIIGFAEVTTTRNTLKTIANELKKEARIKNFENQIGIQQAHIIEQFGRNITSDVQFIDAINELAVPLRIGQKAIKLEDVDNILNLIKRPNDSKIIEQQTFYTRLNDFVVGLPNIFDEIEDSYRVYNEQFQKIVGDIEKIKKILLEQLLSEGVRLIKKRIVTEDCCPLCLQSKGISELLNELEARIGELSEYRKEKSKLDEYKGSLKKIINPLIQNIVLTLADIHFETGVNTELKAKVGQIKGCLENYAAEADIDYAIAHELRKPQELVFRRNILSEISEFCSKQKAHLTTSKKDDLKFELHSKIILSRQAYNTIKKIKKEKEILESQCKSVELIYANFLQKQREGLGSFISHFSNDINNIYQFLNPDERVHDIKLVSLEKDDELIGLTVQYKFYENYEVGPPSKYLSESHLNCLGIAFFLTSIKAFNKRNNFFVLDDVISSFDSSHRKRFADLLVERFSEYQIIVLTHEKNWFDYVNNLVKNRNWKVNTVKWTVERGTYIDEPFLNLRGRIDSKIKAGDEAGLGNDLRKYLEHLLKLIAFNIKVSMDFRFNDTNEERMSYELLTNLKGELKKQPCEEITTSPVVGRLLGSLFVGDKNSHDATFTPTIGDFKAFWKDIQELEDIFYCTACQKYVSFKFYDGVNKKIRCGCPQKSYKWKL